MSLAFGALGTELAYSYRFYEDYRLLRSDIARKVSKAVQLIREQGPYHTSFHTRKVAGNPDSRFHFMNVDDQYRMVAVLEGRAVLLDLVGNHDETLSRGAKATLREYEERLDVDPETFVRPRGGRSKPQAAETATLFGEQPVSLQQILAQPDQVADLITGDVLGALEGYRDGTIEDWMIFLSPLQVRAVQRAFAGPARVTGGPGTGKTVVALHRAAGYARDGSAGRVLVTSFVKNIPETLEGLFHRLAPDLADRVSFRHIHDLAVDMLRHRDVPVDTDWNAAKARFDRCFDGDIPRSARLRMAGFDRAYVWQEVTRVIEGRGVASLDTYLSLSRHGRKHAMQESARRAVWSVYEEYRAACDAGRSPLADPERVLQLALDAVRTEPTGKRYAAIVVDEAQDVTEVGLRFLCELLEGGSTGRLLLVGDQSQRIYAGGFRLSDAGVDVRGRSTALRVCYRSTDQIMQAVASLGRALSTEDYGEDGLRSLAASTVREGAEPTIRAFRTIDDEVQWVVDQLRGESDLDAAAILVPTNARVDDWVGRLKVAGVPHIRLAQYAGRPVRGVKIGTYARSKGLEFKRVILPGLEDGRFPWGDRNDDDGMLLQGSMLYVAMSRARDRLDITHTGEPSFFLQGLPIRVVEEGPGNAGLRP